MHPGRFRVPGPSGPEGGRAAGSDEVVELFRKRDAPVHPAAQGRRPRGTPTRAAVAARLPRRALLVSALALFVARPSAPPILRELHVGSSPFNETRRVPTCSPVLLSKRLN